VRLPTSPPTGENGQAPKCAEGQPPSYLLAGNPFRYLLGNTPKVYPLSTQSERHIAASIAAHESWAHTPDRSARTANARAALMQKFEDQVDPDGTLPPDERARRAEHARKAYFQRLALKSAKARRLRADANALDADVEAVIRDANVA